MTQTRKRIAPIDKTTSKDEEKRALIGKMFDEEGDPLICHSAHSIRRHSMLL